jgi:hypothetical protein
VGLRQYFASALPTWDNSHSFQAGAVMFESDQHEFDEEYGEPAHPAPPSPKPAAAPVAVQEPIVEEPEEPPQEEFEEQPEFTDPAQGEDVPAPPKKKINWLLYGGFAALVVFGIFVVSSTSKSKQQGPPPGDMGPGIVAASGLRGHLTTQWEGNEKTGKLQYQLRIEPMEDRWQPGFSHVALHAPSPISINVRLLDATGFALCGKEIDIRFDPQNASLLTPVSIPVAGKGKRVSQAERNAAIQAARQSEVIQMQAAETARERGKDIFQNQTTSDGQVTAVNAQGMLPCSPDQYRRANYWDFNTNFPTLAEQAALLDPKAAALAKREEEEAEHPGRRHASRLLQQGFVIQGDDRITGYDALRGVLFTDGKNFMIDKRLGRTTATSWANNYALIHYRCDQHGNCALTEAGGMSGLHARLNE